MEEAKKVRSVLRANFTKGCSQLEGILKNDNPDLKGAKAALDLLETKLEGLKMADENIFSKMLEVNETEENLAKDMDSTDVYKVKFSKLRLSVNELLQAKEVFGDTCSRFTHSSGRKCQLKLPRIELQKFGGEFKDWLPFWSMFQQIHDDPGMLSEDKFQYLLQSMIPGSRAKELIESFPPTRNNYSKAIDSLKSRFGNEDLLIEVYVRELLKLVLSNVSCKNVNISQLYDRLETQLRSLDTLGVSSDHCAAMLYPLVESCLPEDLLRVWQRNEKEHAAKDRLKNLMAFLKGEVDNETRISLAVEGFRQNGDDEQSKKGKPKYNSRSMVPTAAGLINYDEKCLFCEGVHPADKCFKARNKLNLQEKQKILAERKCCFLCLKTGHVSFRCRSNTKCLVCGKRHNVLLCPNIFINKQNEPNVKEKINEAAQSKSDSTLSNITNREVFLQTLVVVIRGNNMERTVRALIDTGSQRSYILKSTADMMGYEPIGKEQLIHSLFGGVHSDEFDHNIYRVKLKSKDDQYLCNFEALDQTVICNNISSVRDGPWMKDLKKLKIQINDQFSPIEVLIGADIAGKLFTGRIQKLSCGLVAMETLLGWTLCGKVPGNASRSSTTMTVSALFSGDMNISDIWQLDVLGIEEPSEKRCRKQIEEGVKEHFLKTISINDEGRYEIHMPWLEGHPPLPENHGLASKRLENTVKKLNITGYFQAYNHVFDEWLSEGIVEIVPEKEVKNYGHYLPHRPVIKEHATTKIRPVFDASARNKNQPSLNQCLEKGINLIELIPAILLRFRLHRIGVVADIKKAFLQISLCKKDRDFVRFLLQDANGNIKVYRHARVVFGVCCSPYLLGAVLEFHLRKYLENTGTGVFSYSKDNVKKLLESFYVDNCVASVESNDELENFMLEATQILADAKFELRGWEHTISDEKENPVSQTPVLGLMWNRKSDVLTINSECFRNISNESVTKRRILSVAQKVFDPIGFSCPVTLCPKLILQKTWESKISWDQEVDEDTKCDFLEWMKELPFLLEIKVPRWISAETENEENWTLHTFCDASKKAYATAIFLRIERKENVHVTLLQAKCRVAPVKPMTIPRLELMAALIGARLCSSVAESLGKDCVTKYFWSDSSTVIAWIRNEEEWATFVWNRVQEIRKLTDHGYWRHLPGNMNPADLPSRGCSAKALVKSRWWEGPAWLYNSPATWPSADFVYNEDEVKLERKKRIISSVCFTDWKIENLMILYSSYTKTIRVLGWIRRFINNCSKLTRNKESFLSAQEIIEAEKVLLKFVQKETFINEKNTRLDSLSPIIDEDGIIRLKTRIFYRKDDKNFRSPIVLPSHHPVVDSLIRQTHIDNCHVGIQGLLSILREQYWILGGRRTLRSVLSKCTACQRQKVKKMEVTTTPLPEDRVRDASVFEVSGVDYAGPVYLKNGKKAWICLFTCAVYRGVHLELVTSMSTTCFLQALRRFIARRGRPSIIYSDNGTNFVGANNAFIKLDWSNICKYSTAKKINWKFNPPSAAWWGGWWERLIRLVKELLKKILGRASLNFEEMLTVLCDCEAVINSRPITYVSEDAADLVALTPAMFMQDLKETGVPDCDAVEACDLNRRLKYRLKLKKDLRCRFRSEYLGQLRQTARNKSRSKIKIGEIVLIGSDNAKKLDWPLAIVEELLPGKDGEVRLVRVRTCSGTLLRPLQRIYPLECGRQPADMKINLQSDNISNAVPETSENDELIRGSEQKEDKIVTRSGRVVKKPQRLVIV